jgi:GTP cyclohydrolase I
MNLKKIESLWKEIIKEIGENPNRQGLRDTPKRISHMYKEIFNGYNKNKKPKVTIFQNGQDGVYYDGIICDKGSFFSHCEHHGVPFFGEYFFAYVPNKKIIGLSKIARVIDFYSSRFQLQERLTKQIAEEIEKTITPRGLIFVLRARHLCKEMRGVKKTQGFLITSVATGVFRENKGNIKEEFMELVGLKSLKQKT